MKKRIFLLPFFFLFLFVLPVYGQADFTDMVTFGNSLTHNDFLGPMHGLPQDMYGRDPSEAIFEKGALPGDQLTNYAVAGSQSGHVNAQIDLYELYRFLGLQDKATLIGFEIGSNDVLNNIYLLAASPPGVDPNADAVIDNIINNVTQDLTRLYNTHLDAQFANEIIMQVNEDWNDTIPFYTEEELADLAHIPY